jgi:transcriptional accessory protein Tex/SPT6
VQNPNEVVKLGEIVKAKLILLDTKNRKIWLSMKDSVPTTEWAEKPAVKKPAAKKPSKGLEDVVKMLEEEKE